MTVRMKMTTMMLLMMMIFEKNLPVVSEERFLKDTAPPMPDTFGKHSLNVLSHHVFIFFAILRFDAVSQQSLWVRTTVITSVPIIVSIVGPSSFRGLASFSMFTL